MKRKVLALVYRDFDIPVDAILFHLVDPTTVCVDAQLLGPVLVLIDRGTEQALEKQAALSRCVVEYFSNVTQVFKLFELNANRPAPHVVFPWAELFTESACPHSTTVH